jgi:hypothetical protein
VIGLWVIDQLVRLLRGRASRPRVQVADGLPGEEPHARVGS